MSKSNESSGREGRRKREREWERLARKEAEKKELIARAVRRKACPTGDGENEKQRDRQRKIERERDAATAARIQFSLFPPFFPPSFPVSLFLFRKQPRRENRPPLSRDNSSLRAVIRVANKTRWKLRARA
jgi:hypothetical protein